MNEESLLIKIDRLEQRINELEDRQLLNGKLKKILADKKTKLVFGFIVICFILSAIAYAATVSKPYTFVDGELASASEVNANFDTLYTLVNGNLNDDNISGISASKITSGTLSSGLLPVGGHDLKFPDGINGTIVHERVNSTDTYTVPEGKTLYVVICTGNIWLDGISQIVLNANQIGIFAAGAILKSSDATYYGFTGFLVNSGVSVINKEVNDTNTYTVPIGKTLIVTSGGPGPFRIDGLTGSVGVFSQAGIQMFESGATIKNVVATYIGFTGYLTDN
jgi:hypothetical protein